MRMLLWLLLHLGLFAADWPQFRGPNLDGVTAEVDLPVTWSEQQNVAWKTPLRGKAWSSPVIWDDKIWLTTAPEDGKQLFAIAIDRQSGKPLVCESTCLAVTRSSRGSPSRNRCGVSRTRGRSRSNVPFSQSFMTA